MLKCFLLLCMRKKRDIDEKNVNHGLKPLALPTRTEQNGERENKTEQGKTEKFLQHHCQTTMPRNNYRTWEIQA